MKIPKIKFSLKSLMLSVVLTSFLLSRVYVPKLNDDRIDGNAGVSDSSTYGYGWPFRIVNTAPRDWDEIVRERDELKSKGVSYNYYAPNLGKWNYGALAVDTLAALVIFAGLLTVIEIAFLIYEHRPR